MKLLHRLAEITGWVSWCLTALIGAAGVISGRKRTEPRRGSDSAPGPMLH